MNLPSDIQEKIRRIDQALLHLSSHIRNCRLCPRECGVNRGKGELGFCQTGPEAFLSHAILHYGEEPVLSGNLDDRQDRIKTPKQKAGSGTVFFSGCNLKCLFCQNYQLSWLNHGEKARKEALSSSMLRLQHQGALNINLVSPTHQIPAILRSLKQAYLEGLDIPIVYNSNGYEKAEILEHLDRIIDIYLPDIKYVSPSLSQKYSGAPDYFQHAGLALKEMHRQRPFLICDQNEIALKGLIIRHLVLPGQTEDSLSILDWIARNLSTDVCISLMSQYHPCYKAPPELQKKLFLDEYRKVLNKAQEIGFETLFIQPDSFTLEEHKIPDFTKKNPFDWS